MGWLNQGQMSRTEQEFGEGKKSPAFWAKSVFFWILAVLGHILFFLQIKVFVVNVFTGLQTLAFLDKK